MTTRPRRDLDAVAVAVAAAVGGIGWDGAAAYGTNKRAAVAPLLGKHAAAVLVLSGDLPAWEPSTPDQAP